MDRFLCEQRTVYFYRRKSVKCLHNCFVGNFKRLLDSLALYQLGCHTAGRNCRATAKRLEFCFLNDTVVIDIEIHTHDISAFCVTNGSHTARVLDLSNVSRIIKMVHYLFTIHK